MQSHDFTMEQLLTTRRMRFLAWLVLRCVVLLYPRRGGSWLSVTLQTSKGAIWLGWPVKSGSLKRLPYLIERKAQTFTKSPTPEPSTSIPPLSQMMMGADKLERSWNSRSNTTVESEPSAQWPKPTGCASTDWHDQRGQPSRFLSKSRHKPRG